MKPSNICLVTNIYGHGKPLSDVGTSLALAIQKMDFVCELDIITHFRDGGNIRFSEKVQLQSILDPSNPISYIRAYFLLRNKKYDRVIFNSMPTSQGGETLSNLLYLCLPIVVSLVSHTKTSVLYHNSPFLNDVKNLGYSSNADKLKGFILRYIERMMFLTSEVFFLLDNYTQKIRKKFPTSRIQNIKGGSINAFPTLYLNGVLETPLIIRESPSRNTFRVLLYGIWGPQKNLEIALEAIKNLNDSGIKMECILAGGPNVNFPDAMGRYLEIEERYANYLSKVEGYVEEKNIIQLFSNCDIIVLPYRVPGGFSGVLSIAMFFSLCIILPEFPEYVEQCSDYNFVSFIPTNYNHSDISRQLAHITRCVDKRAIIMRPKSEFEKFCSEIRKMLT